MMDQTELCTLKVLHLPPGLSNEKREELFKHYGAIKTRTIRKSAKYTITFVEFSNKELAREALVRLHQLPVKGRRLSLEFAKKNVSMDERDKENDDVQENVEDDAELEQCKANYREFMKKLNNWAPQSLFMQPIPPNIKYKYPPATKSTVLRIAVQLLKEPTFYTQVLHLMNRMNILPPFEELEEKYPMVKELYDVDKKTYFFDFEELQPPRDEPVLAEQFNIPQLVEQPLVQHPFVQQPLVEQPFVHPPLVEQPIVQQPLIQEPIPVEEEEDEEESEYESDGEPSNVPEHIIPEKSNLQKTKKVMKKPNLLKLLKQPVVTSTSKKRRPQDVFDLDTSKPKQRKLVVEVASKKDDAPTFIVESTGNAEGFGKILPAKKDEEKKEESSGVITSEELQKNKMSNYTADKVFANYSPGNPYFKLYIKNLDKHVEESDLHYIFRRYVLPNSSKDEAEYDVKIMKSGKMKGQAFVTLQNTEQARIALMETNGYHLKEKPMVVQFSKPKG